MGIGLLFPSMPALRELVLIGTLVCEHLNLKLGKVNLVLFALPRSAFSITSPDRYFDTEVSGCLRHFPSQHFGVTEHQNSLWTFRRHSQCLKKRVSHRTSQRRRDGVSDLPGPMPFGYMEPKPVRKPVQTGHLPHRHAAWNCVVNRSRTRECASRRVGSGPKSIAQAFCCQLVEPRYRLDLTSLRCSKLPA